MPSYPLVYAITQNRRTRKEKKFFILMWNYEINLFVIFKN